MTIPRPNTHPDVAKNQHLVPQTYMRAWSYNGGNSVWVYDKKRLDEGFPISAGEDVWKIESRSIERINAITNFYDMKAGDMYLSEKALDEIYGFLNGYDISFEGESLDTYEKLNQHYFDIDNWEIKKPDGTTVFKREHNLIKQNLQQARNTFIETNWSSQYENEWESFINDIEARVRIKKKLLPGKAYLRSQDMEKLPLCCNEVKIAEDGEVLVKGDNVMQGYYHNETENEKVFVDRWFRTGDIGFIDEYGALHITTIKKGYGFRVVLTFADETTMTKQHAGFKTKREANAERDEVVGQLRDRTYVVYDKIRVADFLTYWLEDVMRVEITSDSYDGYKNVVYNYVIPKYGKMYMSTLNQGYITNLYKEITDKYESVARIAKTVMKTALDYAKSKSVVSVNCAIGVSLPKSVKKTEYRVRQIDTQKTMTLPQVLTLIEASKETPIYMQILFAVLMGLRRGEINGLKYSDIDYINRTLRVKRQLGKKPNSKAEDVAPKMLTKQDIPVKTDSSVRELPIPDFVFEAILEQRKIYEKNRRRRKREFRDWDYICCSSYGNPRSKSYHFKYYKQILAENNLPNIHFHQLRNTYSTLLMKNDFNVKGISNLMGHAKEIITIDVYGDTQEIIEDCLYAIEPFIEEVMPEYREDEYYDYSDFIEMENLTDEYWIAA